MLVLCAFRTFHACNSLLCFLNITVCFVASPRRLEHLTNPVTNTGVCWSIRALWVVTVIVKMSVFWHDQFSLSILVLCVNVIKIRMTSCTFI